MRCPASSGAHVVPLPVALKLSIHLSGGEEGKLLISSAVTDSTITDARKEEEEKKSGHCHSGSLFLRRHP